MQITLLLLSGFLFSVLFGMVIIPRILVISHKKRLYDVPDSRKVHTTPVPRLGGLSFFSGDPDVHVPCDRLPPVLLGYGLIEPVVQHAL